jgi:hypothetical protein
MHEQIILSVSIVLLIAAIGLLILSRRNLKQSRANIISARMLYELSKLPEKEE